MPTRTDCESLNALIAGAVARCEHAQAEFERIYTELQRCIDAGRAVTSSLAEKDERARLEALRNR